QAPKLLWLKENLPQTWQRTARFLDLPDFLTYRATGNDTRSLCTTVCKWNFQGHNLQKNQSGWDDSYWNQIGLNDFVQENYKRIGQRIRPMGEAIGHGLTEKSAKELGLLPGTPVGVSIIDAHAGGLGVLGAKVDDEPITPEVLDTRVALIGGTSSCHMAAS